MKKALISAVVLMMLMFLVGCVDYKAYDLNPTGDVVSEIAAVENEINKETTTPPVSEDTTPTAVVPTDIVTAPEVKEEVAPTEVKEEVIPAEVKEEVVLPELGTAPVDVSTEDLSVIRVKENQLITLRANVTDPNGDPVTITFGPPFNKLNGKWHTNYSDAGEYIVSIFATDKRLTTEKKVKVVVERVNVRPIITGIKDLTVKEGETVNLKPIVKDPNSDAVTVTISTPLTEGTWKTDYNSAGTYPITVTASDGELDASETITLKVTDVNQKPEVSNVPATLHVKEGETVKIEPNVVDLDGDKVKVTISGPVGDSGVWQTDYTDHGTYLVTVTVTDGKDTITKTVNLVVEAVNMPPVIEDVQVQTE